MRCLSVSDFLYLWPTADWRMCVSPPKQRGRDDGRPRQASVETPLFAQRNARGQPRRAIGKRRCGDATVRSARPVGTSRSRPDSPFDATKL
eukprot:scaffold1798_cov376-Prasinococcus_capsulatus_cf.AAC.5